MYINIIYVNSTFLNQVMHGLVRAFIDHKEISLYEPLDNIIHFSAELHRLTRLNFKAILFQQGIDWKSSKQLKCAYTKSISHYSLYNCTLTLSNCLLQF